MINNILQILNIINFNELFLISEASMYLLSRQLVETALRSPIMRQQVDVSFLFPNFFLFNFMAKKLANVTRNITSVKMIVGLIELFTYRVTS